jgi:hypothetical protein
MSQLPHNPQPKPPEKSLLLQAMDGVAGVLAFLVTLLVVPSLVDATAVYFIKFMSQTLASGFNELYYFLWWMVLFLIVLGGAFTFLHVKLVGFVTRMISKNYQ